MPPSTLQSLASRRPRRPAKPTARVQQLLDEQQERAEREEQAREKTHEKALAKRKAKRINTKGDELMYGPTKRVAAPTITGDDDLDRQKSEWEEAREIMRLLAHRGDGDWSLHYELGEVGLPLLRAARGLPGVKIIECAIGELALTSSKGKGKAKAIGSNEDSSVPIESSGQRSTAYSGITIGKSHSEPSFKKDISSATLGRGSFSPRPIAAPKRPAPVDDSPLPSKKPRVDSLGSQKPIASGGSKKREVTSATPPDASLGKHAPYPKPVTFGSQGPAPIILGSQPNFDANQPRPQKPMTSDQCQAPSRPPKPLPRLNEANPAPAPAPQIPIPSLPVQVSQKQRAREPAWTDWRLDNVPQPRTSKYGASANHTSPPRDQLLSFQKAKDRLAAALDPNHTRPIAGETNHQVVKNPVAKPVAAKPVAAKPFAAKPAVAAAKPKPSPAVAKPKPKPTANPAVAKPKPKPNPAITRPKLGKPAVIRPGARKPQRVQRPQADNPRSNKPRPNRPQGSIPHERPANRRAGKTRKASPRPRAPAQQQRVLARDPQRRRPNYRNQATPDSDDEADDEEDEGSDDEYNDNERRHNVAQNNQRGPEQRFNPKPTVESFEPRERGTVKLMIRKAKPWIIAVGTFSWRAGDPGEVAENIDTIVARCFARACIERARRFALLTEHIACVKNLVTTYRHTVKAAVIVVVEKVIGFVDADRPFNRKLVRWLLPDAFHEATPELRGDHDPFESKFIFLVVARVLFGPGELGIKHADLFAPVPIRFLAFICAICNHVIYCYRRGSFAHDEHLKSTVQEQSFHGYLTLLDDMQRERPEALRTICATMYDKGRERAGHNVVDPVVRPARRWAPDVDEHYVPRFGAPAAGLDDETDRDDEPDQDDEPDRDNESDRDGDHRPAKRRKPEYEQGAIEDSDDDNHGEGPSKPYGAEADEAEVDEEEVDEVEADEAEADEVPEPKGWPKRNEELYASDEEMDE